MPREYFLLVGDSFIRRLDRLIQSDLWAYRSFKKNFGLGSARVDLYGRVDGRKISNIVDVEEWISSHHTRVSQVDVLCIQVGSNDLLGDYYGRSADLAREVYNLAKLAIEIGAKRVVVLPTMFRQGAAAIPRWSGRFSREDRDSARRSYNDAVVDFNRRVLALCRDGEAEYPVVCMEPRGLRRSWGRHLRDGCHFFVRAYRVYYRNLRSMLVSEGQKCWR